ncbi:MAG: site-specific integrase [Bacteroidia bacterium]|nr:site-specific integrase [Bacteroidia bacterium]
MQNQVSTGIYLDTRRQLKDGSYPTKLRVTFQRDSKFYATGISLTAEDFDKTKGARPRDEHKNNKFAFAEIEKRALEVIAKIHPFNFEEFEARYLNKTKDGEGVVGLFLSRIADLENEGSFGTAMVYRNAMDSLNLFEGGTKEKRANIKFSKITVTFLRKFENWMEEKGNGKTTISMYMRQVRSIFNLAIRKKYIDRDYYPFGKDLYTIPTGRKGKIALTLAEIKKLVTYDAPAGSQLEFARDMWFFSYLCNGANIKDIARLKYKNVASDRISFIRAKTEKKSLKEITAVILPQTREILDRHGLKADSPESFVFPIVPAGIDKKTARAKRQQAIKQINKYIRIIAKEAGIEKDVTTYTARHSFATVLKRSGKDISFISESLGHSSMKTTENYLNDFEFEQKEENAKALINF